MDLQKVGTIAHNIGSNYGAGGILVNLGSHLTMSGGTIEDNTARRGGGVTVCGSNSDGSPNDDESKRATFEMTGGEIKGNHATLTWPDSSDTYQNTPKHASNVGGGVYVSNNASFVLKGGQITQNKTSGFGGGVATDNGNKEDNSNGGAFTMTGGEISENVAASGGGIYSCSVGTVDLISGSISDNTATASGGGVYTATEPYDIKLHNAVVTLNTAEIGGGLWLCPEGMAYDKSKKGAAVNSTQMAVYKNNASGAGDDVALLGMVTRTEGGKTYNHEYYLGNQILGGGTVQWYKDGDIVPGTYNDWDTLPHVREDQNQRCVTPFNPDNQFNNIVSSGGNYALKANLTEEGQKLLEDFVSNENNPILTITGNKAKQGGGIGGNGTYYTDNTSKTSIKVTKVWTDGEASHRSEEVVVQLIAKKDKVSQVIDTEKLHAGNKWTYQWDKLDDSYTYDIKEISDLISDNGKQKDIKSLYNVKVTSEKDKDDPDKTNYQITNTKRKAEGSVELRAIKYLNGTILAKNDDRFQFELKDEKGNVIDTSEVDEDGNIKFRAINYTMADYTLPDKTDDKTGVTYVTYAPVGTKITKEYTISEKIPTGLEPEKDGKYVKDGVTYDPTVYNVKVTLEDNGDGTFNVTKEYSNKDNLNKDTPVDENQVIFYNQYDSQGTAIIKATKKLTGRALKEGETFQFELLDENKNPIKGETASSDADGNITFPAITYHRDDAGKTFTYYIHEIPGDDSNITYDKHEVEVKVAVTDNGDGNLVTKVEYVGGKPEFTNTYNSSGSVTLTAKKVVNNGSKKPEEGQFRFALEDANGMLLQTKTNDAEGKVTFNTIPYTQEDVKKSPIEYKIHEINQGKPGYEYDSAIYTALVTLTDDGNGKITTSVTYKKNGGEETKNTALFDNKYQASGSIVLTAAKNLTGRALNEKDKFTFQLSQVTKEKTGTQAAETKELQTKQNTGDSVTFDQITYTEPGTYHYTIREDVSEIEPNDKGQYVKDHITYDTHTEDVYVTVTDNGDGTLTAVPTYKNGDTVDKAGAAFTNEYHAEGDVAIRAKKVLTGKALADKEYTFVLTDESGKELKREYNVKDGSINFDNLRYTQEDVGQTFIYKIHELSANNGGVGYDGAEYTVTVTPVDDGQGHVTAKPVYLMAGTEVKEAVFHNTYTSKGSFTPTGKKTLTGRALTDQQFSFYVTEKIDGKDTVVSTGTNYANGEIHFTPISYTQADMNNQTTVEKQYTVVEVEPSTHGDEYTYDSSKKNITVLLTDDGNGSIQAALVKDKSDAVAFTNTYTATGSIQLGAKKAMVGKELGSQKFTFKLLDQDGKPVTDANGKAYTAQNDEKGNVLFDQIHYTEKDLGPDGTATKTYQIVEQADSQHGITYDSTVYTVKVSLKDNGDGTITASSDLSADDVKFTNIFKDQASVALQAKKVLTGKELVGGQFEFELVGPDGKVLQTKTNDANGQIAFDPLTYTEADASSGPKTITYTIREKNGGQEAYTYDNSEKKVTVTLAYDKDGKLTATADKNAADLTFNNIYRGTTAELKATKQMEGRELKGTDHFEFVLAPVTKGAPMPVSDHMAVTEDQPTADFGSITYEKTGTYEYTIKEIIPSEAQDKVLDGVTYDDTYHKAVVVVTKGADGQLSAKVTYDGKENLDAAVITNTYDTSTSINITGNKQITGGANVNPEGKFTMKLTEVKSAEDKTPVEGGYSKTTKTNADGSFAFNIDYQLKDLGDHYYLLDETEIPEGYTKKTEAQLIQVRVSKDQDDKLVAVQVAPENNPTIVNQYDAKGSVTLEAEKKLKNKELKAGDFTFDLMENGQVKATAVNDKDGKIVFHLDYDLSDLGGQKEAVKHYTLSEERPASGTQNGIAYADDTYHVEVALKDNGDGTITATPSYQKGDEKVDKASFTNEYHPEGQLPITGTKTLSGRQLLAGEFSFVIKDADGEQVATGTNDAGGTITFDKPLTFTEADMGGQKDTYKSYTVEEVPPDPIPEGYTYDSSVKKIKVHLMDDGKGTIVASLADGSDPITFKNKFKADGSVSLHARKSLDGKALAEGQFRFELRDDKGIVLQTVANDGSGLANFQPIAYNQDDLDKSPIKYTIAEVDESKPGYTYDKTVYYVSVDLTSDGKEIQAVPTYQKKKNGSLVNADEALFENQYHAKGDVVLKASKKLAGRDIKDGEFSFVLNETDKDHNVLKDSAYQTKRNDGNQITFDEITYDHPGTYYYMITETKGQDENITYDPHPEYVTVTVIDDGKGNLIATPQYDADGAVFQNTYTATGKVTLQAQKELKGKALAKDQFTFDLMDKDGKVIDTAKNDADGKVTFKEIAYSEKDLAKSPIIYQIVERVPEGAVLQDGQYILNDVTYTRQVYTVKVELSDDGKGNITVTPIYQTGDTGVKDATFTNVYQSKAEIPLTGKKTLEGRRLEDQQFHFYVKNDQGVVVSTGSNDQAGNISFDKPLTFTQADLAGAESADKVFTVEEVKPSSVPAGYTYDESVKKITVHLSYDEDGKLTAKIADGSDTIAFKNSYQASGKITLGARKKVDGTDLKAQQFTFALKDQDGKVIDTTKNDADGKVTFKELSYDQGDLNGKEKATKTYTISEVNDKQSGYTYATVTYPVVVTLEDLGNGEIKTSADLKAEDAVFINTYDAEGQITLYAKKTLVGQDLEGGQFTFELKDADGKVLQTKTNTADGLVAFDPITYKKADAGKTYTYTVVEKDGGKEAYTYDKTVHTVNVKVEDAGNGTLTVTPDQKVGKTDTGLTFKNTYIGTKAKLAVTKQLSGREWNDEDSFTFQLAPVSKNAPMPEAADGTSVTLTKDQMSAAFAEITYDQTGSYEYTITEAEPDGAVGHVADGVKYDTTSHKATVQVTKNPDSGRLEATVLYDDGKKDLTVVNQYNAHGSTVIPGTKTVNHQPVTDALGKFTFKLDEVTDETGKVLKEDGYSKTVKTNADGTFEFTGLNYELKDVGEHYYKLDEIDLPAGYQKDFDSAVIGVNVVDNHDGTLTATVDKMPDKGSFNNTYQAEGSLVLKASKKLSNKDLKADQFNFELKDSEGNVIDTAKNDKEGNVTFKKLSFTSADLTDKTYTISETEPADTKGISYDKSVYTVTVKLTDNGDGTITATPTYQKDGKKVEDAQFQNTYSAVGSTEIHALKTLSGRNLKAGEFTFELLDGNEVVSTAKNNADGQITLQSPQYSLSDAGKTYTYKIREAAGDIKAVDYDKHEEEVTVKVVDNGDGTLTATAQYDTDGAVFANAYHSEGNVVLSVKKDLTGAGRKLADEQFSFELRDSSGRVLQTKTNDAEGNVAFDKIAYTEEDVKNSPITYTIREKNDGKKGYTYDSKVYTVSVDLTDDGQGKITAVPTYKVGDTVDKDPTFHNTYAASGQVSLRADKELTGRAIKDGEFTFALTGLDDKVSQTKTNSGTSVIFDNIKYAEPGVYHYTITETKGEKASVGYDSHAEEVTVTVSDKGDGTLKAVPNYDAEGAVFKNTYTSEGSVVLRASKTLKTKRLAAGEFTFALKDADGKVLQTKANAEDGSVAFDQIKYDQTDVTGKPIVYTIEEQIPDDAKVVGDEYVKDGVTYNRTVYTAEVTLKDDGEGKITAVVDYKDGYTSVQDAVFENVYESKGQIEITGQKSLAGRALEDGQFHFYIKNEVGSVVSSGSNDVAGKITFDQPLTFTQVDMNGKTDVDKTYTVEEVVPDPKPAGYTFDQPKTIKIHLTDDGNGKITAQVTDDSQPLEFANTYEAKGDITLQAEKKVAGTKLKDQQFTFALSDEDGQPVIDADGNPMIAKNDADGKVTFKPLVYTQDDLDGKKIATKRYTISEVNDKQDGYTYSDVTYPVVVTLEDLGTGVIKTSADLKADDVVFTNPYHATGTITLGAKKTLKGQTLKGGMFDFELVDQDGKVLQTKTNDADGKVTFDTIAYDETDLEKAPYIYTIREKADESKPYIYDDSEQKVTVTLEDDGKGKITAQADKKAEEIEFTNTYIGTQASIGATKALSGRDWTDTDKFAFDLKAVTADAPMPDKQIAYATKANPTADFGQVLYEKEGTYEYQITEEVPAGAVDGVLNGLVYDTNSHKVIVKVVKDPDSGQLIATVTYDDSLSNLTITNTQKPTGGDNDTTEGGDEDESGSDDTSSGDSDYSDGGSDDVSSGSGSSSKGTSAAKTGDMNTTGWLLILAVAAGSLVVLVSKRRKDQESEEN